MENYESLSYVFSKRLFSVKNWKREHHHWILHIRSSLGNKFQLFDFDFLDQVFSKGNFCSQKEKVNITISRGKLSHLGHLYQQLANS